MLFEKLIEYIVKIVVIKYLKMLDSVQIVAIILKMIFFQKLLILKTMGSMARYKKGIINIRNLFNWINSGKWD